MIKFEDFLKVDSPSMTKVKFNMNPNDPRYRALDYLMDNEKEWINMNAYKSKHASNNLAGAKYLLAFAQYYPYGSEFYIFGGMYKVEKIKPEIFDGNGYKLELSPKFIEYRKRLIIKLKKPIGRDIYMRNYSTLQSQLDPEIYELAPSTKLGAFPGYNSVSLKHSELRMIVENDAPEWRSPLSKVKGIYCITDNSNGQLYIGSASGDNEGIWQRWSAYAKTNNLTGGNKTFEEIKSNGAENIIDNFTYTILEIFDMRTDRGYILNREEYWKRVFCSVEYGMNNNAKNINKTRRKSEF